MRSTIHILDDTSSSAPEFLDLGLPDAIEKAISSFGRNGLVFLDGISTEEDALKIARECGEILPHRDSEPSGLTRILCKAAIAGQPGFKGFSADKLFPHTDQSCLKDPARVLVQVCREQAGTGGGSVFVDGLAIYQDLARNFPELLGYLISPRAAVFSDGQSSHCGAIFETLEDGSIGVRFRHDSCMFFSAQLAPHIGYLIQLIERHTLRLVLNPGQAYIINNRRWLHGRESFLGEREMWRILLKPAEGPMVGVPEGFVFRGQGHET